MTATPFKTEVGLRVLAAACDIAVIRALELIGKRIAASGGEGERRARFGAMNRSGRQWHEAHTIWSATPSQIDAGLAGAWAMLPRLSAEHGCCGLTDPQLVVALDGYVREIVSAQRPHAYSELERRLRDVVA